MKIIPGKFLFLLIFAITLCIYPLYTIAQTVQPKVFAHVEENSNYILPAETPRIMRLRVYDDNTTVVRIVRKNPATTINGVRTCFYEIFSLRIIHPDGTVDEKDITLNIPPINYCFLTISAGAAPIKFLDYFLINKNYILVTYVEASDPGDPSTYEDWGIIIDFDGKVYSKIFFGPKYIDINTKQFVPSMDPKIILNVNRAKGFIRLYSLRGIISTQEWQQYKIEPDGTITKLTSEIVPVYSDALVGTMKSLVGGPIATVDEGYAISFANTVNNLTGTAENPLLQQAQVFIIPIGYNKTAAKPLLLYQSSLPNLNFTGIDCGVAFAGIGQTCVLTVTQRDISNPVPAVPDKNFLLKVDFLSSGSTISVTIFNGIAPIDNAFPLWDIKSLRFGGFLTTNVNNPTPGTFNKRIFGYLFDGVSVNPMPWGFPEPVLGNVEGVYDILPNNTLLVAQFENGNSWQILSIDLPNFAGNKDIGYKNLNVESTSPAINSKLGSNMPDISINFYKPVDLSNGTLSIYQIVDNQQGLPNPNRSNPIYQVDGDRIYILRQSIPGKECSIGNGGKTVTAKTLRSTFSSSEGNYFATIDNEFVRDSEYNEPLLGIDENIWNFVNTEIKDIFAPGADGLLRLSPSGTQAFDRLSPEEQSIFFDTLLSELSFAIPIPRSRLTTLKKIQPDKESKDKRYLISIGIQQTRNLSEISVASVIRLVNIMVENKDQSAIGRGHATSYVDETFGFIQSPNLWETYKTRLIGLFIVIGIFVALFIFAQVRSSKAGSEASNFAIFKLGLILFDLAVDMLFASTNAKDIPVLYIPSVVFVTLPLVINTTLAFYIITQENTKPQFYKWFAANGNVASIFTLLAGADIEALDILKSNLAGLPYFQAPFSDHAESKIFWGAFLNIFTEDIPQVIIQIYYRANSVTYDIVPLLTLISSSINLIINIIGRLYKATNRMRLHNIGNYDTPNDEEEFGGLENGKVVENPEKGTAKK